MQKRTFIAVAAAVMAIGGAATPALAGTGCNGVVNWFVWGCAGWDNNNGPKFPYFRKKTVTVFAPAGSKVETKDGRSVVDIGGVKYPLANGVIAPGGANVIAPGGANVIAPGGANLQVVVQN